MRENSQQRMAKAIVGAGGIETISGALKRPKKQNGHNHGTYLVMTHRTAETTNPNCQRIYAFAPDRYTRKTSLSQNEIKQQNKFGAIARAVNARLKDLNQSAIDAVAFKAQSTYKTLRQFVWAAEQERWEQDNE